MASALRQVLDDPIGQPQRIPIYRNEPEFIDRINNPQNYPVIQNPDGSVSTHRMAAESDAQGNFYVFPTIQMEDGRLVEYEDNRQAMDAAFRSGNILQAPNMLSALRYAEGGYKQGTPLAEDQQAARRELENRGVNPDEVAQAPVPSNQSVMAAPTSRNPFNPAFRETARSFLNNYFGGSNIAGREGYRTGQMVDAAVGAMDFAPAIGDAIGVGDLRQSISARDPAGIAINSVAMLPLVGTPAAKVLKKGRSALRETNPNLDQSYEARMQRAQEQGFTGPYYHGSSRTDRLLETGALQQERATSGPMPFFTTDPELASGYAKGKKDTSLEIDSYADAYTVNPAEFGLGNRTSPITVEESWNYLSPEKKREIMSKVRRIGYEDLEQATGKIVLHPEGTKGLPSSDEHFDYIMRTSAKGNPLAALRELWVDSGNLYNEEELLENIYKLSGYDKNISQINAPWTEASGVLPVMMRLNNPLDTLDTRTLQESIIPNLRRAFADPKYSVKKPEGYGADMWDKNVRFSPQEWVESLAEDVAKGENSYVWTSIPDEVTQELKNLGYDSIIDISGKGGGTSEKVIIPFEPEQIRSTNAEFDPQNIDSADLLSSRSRPMSALRGMA